MPEGVQAAVEEEREVTASSHAAEGSVEHKSEAAGQRLLAGRAMWGWLEAALPAWLLPHTRSSLAEAGGQLWLLVTLQILGTLSTLVVHLTELLNATAGLQDHLLRNGDHHTEEVWVLKALK